jgi:hypothetical protein
MARLTEFHRQQPLTVAYHRQMNRDPSLDRLAFQIALPKLFGRRARDPRSRGLDHLCGCTTSRWRNRRTTPGARERQCRQSCSSATRTHSCRSATRSTTSQHRASQRQRRTTSTSGTSRPSATTARQSTSCKSPVCLRPPEGL